MKRMAIVLVLVGCHGSASKNATPKGTQIITWDASKSTREAFKTATFENRSTKDSVITVKTCNDDVKLALHMETATAKYTEGDHPVTIVALSSLTVSVEDGKGFEITKGTCDGPNYELAAPNTAPGYSVMDCHYKATKPNNDCATLFQLKGDGTQLP